MNASGQESRVGESTSHAAIKVEEETEYSFLPVVQTEGGLTSKGSADISHSVLPESYPLHLGNSNPLNDTHVDNVSIKFEFVNVKHEHVDPAEIAEFNKESVEGDELYKKNDNVSSNRFIDDVILQSDNCTSNHSYRSEDLIVLQNNANFGDGEKCKSTYFLKADKCKRTLSNHVNVDKNEKSYICTVCQKSFSCSRNLKIHLASHIGGKKFACTLCPKSFNQNCHLKAHLAVHANEKKFKCNVCQKSFNQSFNLLTHLSIHTGEKKFACNFCQKSFNHSSSLKRHLTIHTGERKYVCNFCQKAFSHSSNLTKHLPVHTGEKKFVCNVCQKAFRYSSALKIHLRIHTGEKEYVCSFCQKCFNHSSNLKTHLFTHRGEKRFTCKFCKKSYNKKGYFIRHVHAHGNGCSVSLYKIEAYAITTDSWTPISNNTYMVTTVNFIVNDCNLKTQLLTCLEICSQHMAENIAIELQGKFSKWAITDKIGAIVSDNVANLNATIHNFYVKSAFFEYGVVCSLLVVLNKIYYISFIMDASAQKSCVDESTSRTVIKVEIEDTEYSFLPVVQTEDGLTSERIMDASAQKSCVDESTSRTVIKVEIEDTEYSFLPVVQTEDGLTSERSADISQSLLPESDQLHLGNSNLDDAHVDIASIKYEHVNVKQEHVDPAEIVDFNKESVEGDELYKKNDIVNRFIDDVTLQLDNCTSSHCNRSEDHIVQQNNKNLGNGEKCKSTYSQKAVNCKRTLSNHLNVHKNEKSYICTVCQKSFNRSSNLKTHLAIHIGEKKFACTLCPKSFTQNSHLKAHLAVHADEKKFTCNVCQKSFNQSFNLQTHLSIHTGEKKFACNFCQKSFNHSSSLKTHLSIHTGERKYLCNFCQKSFSQSSNLKKHLSVHTGEKKFMCKFCQKSFSHSSTLKTHLTIHTGEKKFMCNFCQKCFSHSSNLKTHLSIHTGEKKFSCNFCKKSFNRKDALTRHLNAHGKGYSVEVST
ncbi:uncharacterized protein LOC142317716 [Lycorma delicatula]|uniref:uncharacterized protein LOC142317716 n=1 Tax=Lycorma delicatula TaxID=130591 RepID=UPI003F511C5B